MDVFDLYAAIPDAVVTELAAQHQIKVNPVSNLSCALLESSEIHLNVGHVYQTALKLGLVPLDVYRATAFHEMGHILEYRGRQNKGMRVIRRGADDTIEVEAWDLAETTFKAHLPPGFAEVRTNALESYQIVLHSTEIVDHAGYIVAPQGRYKPCPQCGNLMAFCTYDKPLEHGLMRMIIGCPACRERFVIYYASASNAVVSISKPLSGFGYDIETDSDDVLLTRTVAILDTTVPPELFKVGESGLFNLSWYQDPNSLISDDDKLVALLACYEWAECWYLQAIGQRNGLTEQYGIATNQVVSLKRRPA